MLNTVQKREKTDLLIFYWPIRVYYEDTDAGGIVYYANYLKFFERARTEALRSLDINQDEWLKKGVAFVVRNVIMDYKKAAKFNEELKVHSVVSKLQRASLEFEQQIYNQQQELICTAQIKIACVNLSTLKPRAIPEAIFKALG